QAFRRSGRRTTNDERPTTNPGLGKGAFNSASVVGRWSFVGGPPERPIPEHPSLSRPPPADAVDRAGAGGRRGAGASPVRPPGLADRGRWHGENPAGDGSGRPSGGGVSRRRRLGGFHPAGGRGARPLLPGGRTRSPRERGRRCGDAGGPPPGAALG